MQALSNDDILRYVSGRANRELAARIVTQTAEDPEFRARVELQRFLLAALEIEQGGAAEPQVRPATRVGAHRRLLRWVMSVVVVLVLLGGAGAGGWYLFAERPLLQDDFRAGWFDSDIWLPPPAFVREGGVRAEHGHLRLVNRGYLVPRREFAEPYRLVFEWKWTQLGLDPLYADHLSVAVRTTGQAAEPFAHEVSDGIIIKFDAWGGMIRALKVPDLTTVATSRVGEPPLTLPMPAEAWHHIRITDDGMTIKVFFAGPQVPEKYWETPVLEFRGKGENNGRRFAIYNREKVGAPHESLIRNVVVTKLE